MALLENYDSDLEWIYDTDGSDDDGENDLQPDNPISKQGRPGRPSFHSRFPEIVTCVKSFIEQSSAEAQSNPNQCLLDFLQYKKYDT